MSEQSFHLGFTNLDGENEALPLQTEGHIPAWLTGTLFRNGPAKFSTDSGWHTADRNPVQFRRYKLPFGSTYAEYETLTQESLDLPTIHYSAYSGRPYRYAYGISTGRSKPEKYANQLAKVDTVGGQTKIWHEPACYPGEPVFVERPNVTQEDDGVVASVVLDGRQGRSFLAVLDAGSFEELGRAIVPHHIPFGFLGMFTEERWT
jgi:carotenoid cleavage dioxygenase-like enzyme